MDRKEQPPSLTEPPASRPRRSRRRRLIFRLLLAVQIVVDLVFIGALVLYVTSAKALFKPALVHIDPLARADYIVVLGGESDRAVAAAQLYREGWAPKVILSSSGENTDLLAAIAQANGVPKEAMILDRQARRTADHPYTVAGIAGVSVDSDTFIVVTSPFHTSRARACFVKAGYRNLILRGPDWQDGGRQSTDAQSSWTRFMDIQRIAHEGLAWGYYRIKGRV